MIKRIFLLIILLVYPAINYAEVADHLLLQDIGLYRLDKPEKMFPGEPPMGGPRTYDSAGIIAGVGHFNLDHIDKTYEVMYLGGDANVSPTVQVTKHSNSESDKWLLHEVDASLRNYYGMPGKSYMVRQINGNNIILYGAGGWSYRWISGNKIINIEYTDLEMTKPEPLEVVQAYLAKHPSTLPPLTAAIQRSAESKTKWIKDEMDRRLWLCDKWFMQLQLRKVEEKQVYQESVKSMNIFLDYREMYYGMKAADEKNLLAGYLNTNNGTGVKAKLKEYKDWWVVNKEKAINL